MSIRRKFLFLLLAIALVPMVVVVIHSHRAAKDMGHELTEAAREGLTLRLTNQLRRTIDLTSTILRQQKELVELALVVQAREAASRLAASEPPGDLREPVYTDAAFDRLGRDLPGMRPSDWHVRSDANGNPTPLDVSYEAAVFRLAPGVALDDVGEEATRLSTMVHAFRGLHSGREALFRWQYVSLESGLHLSYPGHGGYPEAYDGRKRPWYTRARDLGGLVWIPPLFDATTGQLVSTASVPVRDGSGAIAGVTAIDVDVLGLLDTFQSRATLPPDADFLLVDLARRPDGRGGEGVRVLARKGRASGNWDSRPEANWLNGDGGGTYQELVADMMAGKRGLKRMPFEGVDALWAHAPVDDYDTALLIIFPFSEVVAETAGAETLIRDATLKQVGISGVFALVMVGIVGVLAFVLVRAVTLPVHRLDVAARRLAEGDLESRAEVRGRDELARLAESFNAMVPKLKDQVRLKQSLDLAHEVQCNLLPEKAPDIDGFEIAGGSLPCDETGGDYFDYIPLGKGRLAVAVGDVTGHGVPAALLMATARGHLRARASRAPSISDLLNGVNRELARDALAGRFMTLFYLVLEPGSRRVRWANAGHDAALVVDPSGDVSALDEGGVPLGVDGDWSYEDYQSGDLAPGTVLVLATDGIWEMRNAEDEMFGHDRLQAVIREHASKPAKDILKVVAATLKTFSGGAPLRDDVTLVVVKVV